NRFAHKFSNRLRPRKQGCSAAFINETVDGRKRLLASIHRLRLLTVPSRPERDRREVAMAQPPVAEGTAPAHRTAHDMASGPAGNTRDRVLVDDMADMAADDMADMVAAD